MDFLDDLKKTIEKTEGLKFDPQHDFHALSSLIGVRLHWLESILEKNSHLAASPENWRTLQSNFFGPLRIIEEQIHDHALVRRSKEMTGGLLKLSKNIRAYRQETILKGSNDYRVLYAGFKAFVAEQTAALILASSKAVSEQHVPVR